MTTTTEMTFTTIGALKEFLKDLPDDLAISVDCVGETGYLDGPVKMIKTVWEYDNKKTYDVCIDVPAESGYHY